MSEISEFGVLKFKEKTVYKIIWIYDLILIKGENGSIFQIENYEENEWFLFHFNFVSNVNFNEEIKVKIIA